MAVTQDTHVADGSTAVFHFTFEIIKEADVNVSVDGVLQPTTEYSFNTATSIQFNTGSIPSNGSTVRIYRTTDVDNIRATYFAGSAIRAQDLNNNAEQLLYAIQERGDQFVPKENAEFVTDVDLNNNKLTEVKEPTNAQDAATKNYVDTQTWSDTDETIYSNEAWQSVDTQIATTQAIDQRIDSKIDDALTVDIEGSDGISVTDDSPGSGQITIGLSDSSVDFDKIKDSDQIQLADQVADPDVVGTDNNIFTAQATTRRFNNYYQNTAPTTTDGVGIGQVWVDPDDDLTLSVWSGTNWVGITSGGTFTNQPKVIYVDANSGDDSNDGHRISRPKKTIAAALGDINSDSVYGDGSIVSVAPGIYAETLPLDIQKNDVGIIGQSLRTCIIHPKIPLADQSTYDVDVPHSQELQTMFRVNSGSYFTNLTLTGLKASGSRGGVGSIYTDSTYGLPANQGWNFGFYPNAVIKKSPYIQNVTNFSDSQINNVNFTPHTPGEGAAGDLDSAPTGGGILVDGSVPATTSPLRSMVCDSYTHTALDGPGIFVTNNGYAQCTSSYAFFNHAHITCLNGGQANLAASTTDFGRFGLVADGKSSTAIFTSNVDGAASNGDTTFNINAPSAASDWFGSATRPANNMLVTVNSVTYPVLSATAYTDSEGGAGWTVTISRPDPTNTATNLGLNGAVSDDAAVSFFLRSMIASSGHTMEYVGSGTDYTALPENGGVPVENQQIIERNDGKIWAVTTDHKGTFKLGDFFTIDQQAGSLTVNDGSFQVNLNTLSVNVGGQAEVGADLDMGANELTSSTGDLKLQASGDINVQTNKIINVTDPTAAQDAATKAYVDSNTIGEVVDDGSPQLGGNLDLNGFEILTTGNDNVTINPGGTGSIFLNAPGINAVHSGTEGGQIGISDSDGTTIGSFIDVDSTDTFRIFTTGANKGIAIGQVVNTGGAVDFYTSAAKQMTLDSSGNLCIGDTTAIGHKLTVGETTDSFTAIRIQSTNTGIGEIRFADSDSVNPAYLKYDHNANSFIIASNALERLKIDSNGNVGINTASPTQKIDAEGNILARDATNVKGALLSNDGCLEVYRDTSNAFIDFKTSIAEDFDCRIQQDGDGLVFVTGGNNSAFNRVKIFSNGEVGIGEFSSPRGKLDVRGNVSFGPTNTTDTFQGLSFVNGKDSSSAFTSSYIDFKNNLVVADAHIFANHETNGSSNLTFGTTPAGSRSSDRRQERMRITDFATLINQTASSPNLSNIQPAFQVNEGSGIAMSINRNTGEDQYGANLMFRKTRGSSPTDNTALISGDALGQMQFTGTDGSQARTGCYIQGMVNGTVSSGIVPGELRFINTNSVGGQDLNMRIYPSGTIQMPKQPALKTVSTGQYGSASSLTASPLPPSAIAQANASFTRGDTGYTTSGSNAYTFVCPVDGIYAVFANVSYGNITANTRVVWVMGFTLGGGNLPLASYIEVLDHTAAPYQNESYYEIYYFTAGTRIGMGLNGTSGSNAGYDLTWGCHLVS